MKLMLLLGLLLFLLLPFLLRGLMSQPLPGGS